MKTSLFLRLGNQEYHGILTRPSIKQKPKTRPVEQPEGPIVLPLEPTLDDEEDLSENPTTRQAFDVFTLMYPITAEESAKSLEWRDFLHAMADVDFTARSMSTEVGFVSENLRTI